MAKSLKKSRAKARKASAATKRSPIVVVARPPDADVLLQKARISVDRGVSAIGERIELLIQQIDESDEYDRADASHLAWLTNQQAAIMDRLRKAQDHQRRIASRLSPQLVMEFLRSLPPDRRAHFVRELVEMDSENAGGLLS